MEKIYLIHFILILIIKNKLITTSKSHDISVNNNINNDKTHEKDKINFDNNNKNRNNNNIYYKS